jgi:hypothetical protein
MTAKKPDSASHIVRLSVRTAPPQGERPRYRAGLGPFGREPKVVEVSPAQAETLKADPMLIVEEARG